jgi:hypothetical protein
MLAYAIKVFYFDIVDDNEASESMMQQGRAVRHALHFQTASRWRANVWISSHVFRPEPFPQPHDAPMRPRRCIM